MKFLIFAIILLATVSCNNPTTDTETKKTDSVVKSTDTTAAINHTNFSAENLDSIDKANAVMIGTDMSHNQKASVSKSDSLIWLTANMKMDHRIFGFEKPDTKSKRMILLSIFTNDVDGNPFNLPFGAYYDTAGMDGMQLKFVSTDGAFIKVAIIKNGTASDTVYMERKWIEFEK